MRHARLSFGMALTLLESYQDMVTPKVTEITRAGRAWTHPTPPPVPKPVASGR